MSATAPSAQPTRLVVVTGGSRGIGREIVARFAARGDEVLALGRGEQALTALADELPGVRTALCDVSDEDQVTDVLGALERVDVLVNNAGVSESAPLHRTTLDAWERQLRANATGPFLCTRAVVEGMRARGTGTIVTVASTAGRVGAPYIAAYTASKHAAIGLMRATAAELAGTSVTANAVCPTFVNTDMTQASIKRIADRTGRSTDDSAAALAAAAPLGRLLDPGEVADAVLWLASPEARSINGQTLVLDGGGIQT
jgi:NAD(P)-dependent dehydrogenase (short-subunit alcohol dehydrogenase family)